jgi:hypothetical protein
VSALFSVLFSLFFLRFAVKGILGGRMNGTDGLRGSYTGFTPLQQDRMHTFYMNYRAGK